MKPNLRVGLMLSNHHEELSDRDALHLILEAIDEVRDQVPGELAIAILTPDSTIWAYTLHSGTYELKQSGDGSWEAQKLWFL